MSKLIDFTDRQDFREEFTKNNAWGLSASFDAYNCDEPALRDADTIKDFIVLLCNVIDMKRFGEPHVVHFGVDERVAGFSFTQLIETSLVSGHIANQTNTLYLDIFSCKYFDPMEVVRFVKDYFNSEKIKVSVSLRD